MVKPAVDLMAGIPSIVYGFFGLVVIVPMVQKLTGSSGKGLLTASLLLGMMILPTIIGVAETSIQSEQRSLTRQITIRWWIRTTGNRTGKRCRNSRTVTWI